MKSIILFVFCIYVGDTMGTMGRENYHNIDLNRNFPDQFKNTSINAQQEPETQAVMQWSQVKLIYEYDFIRRRN